MRDKIIDFDPDKRKTKEAWETFKKFVNEIDPEQLGGAFFYVAPIDKATAEMSCFNPGWEMTGRIRIFLNEIEFETYALDYQAADVELDD